MKRVPEGPGGGAPPAKIPRLAVQPTSLSSFFDLLDEDKVTKEKQPVPGAAVNDKGDPMVLESKPVAAWPYIISYVLTLALPGATQLPLLRALITNRLTIGSEVDTPEGNYADEVAEKRAAEEKERKIVLVKLLYEGRQLLSDRKLPVPSFYFNADVHDTIKEKWPTYVEDLHLPRNEGGKDMVVSAPNTFETSEVARLQIMELLRTATIEDSKLFGMAMGMVSMFSSDIQILEKDRGALVALLKTVLSKAVLLARKGSLRILPAQLGREWTLFIDSLINEHRDKVLHLCAELVTYALVFGDPKEMRDNPLLHPLCAIVRILGNNFASYIYCFAPAALDEEKFKLYGFGGDFERHRAYGMLRDSIRRRIKEYEKVAMKVELHDHQREIVIDMVIQEVLPDEIVKEKQAGICGLLLYAEPGTGKTLTALVAAAILKHLNLSPGRKAMFVLPTNATAAFIDDAFRRFKPDYQPRLFSYYKGEFILRQSSSKKSVGTLKEQDIANIDYFILDITMIPTTIPYAFAEKGQFDGDDAKSVKKRALVEHMKKIRSQDWRVFLDESHEVRNRSSYVYVCIRHWLEKRHATFLLTGTAFVKDYYGIMSQLRLLGYRTDLDETIDDDGIKLHYKKLDDNLAPEQYTKMAMAKVKTGKRGDANEEKMETPETVNLETALIATHRSVPVIRAIRHIEKNVLQTSVTAMRPNLLSLIQPGSKRFVLTDDTTISEKVDRVLSILYEVRLGKLNDIMSRKKGAAQLQINPDPDAAPDDADPGEQDDLILKELEAFLDDADLQNLKGVVKELRVLSPTRNLGVDLRLISTNRWNALKGLITKNVHLIEQEGTTLTADKTSDLKVLQEVRAALADLVLYRPNKNVLKNEESILDLVDDLAKAPVPPNTSIRKFDEENKAKVRAIVGLDGINGVPTRAQSIFDVIAAHMNQDQSNKAVVFAREKDVMQSFTLRLLNQGDFRIARTKEDDSQLLDEQEFPNANYVLVLSASNTPEDRRRLLKVFNESPKIRVIISTLEIASTGLNLQEANLVVLYQELANSSEHTQAMARVLRLGQTKQVTVVECFSRNTGEIIQRAVRYARKNLNRKFDNIFNAPVDDENRRKFDLITHEFKDLEQIFSAIVSRAPTKNIALPPETTDLRRRGRKNTHRIGILDNDDKRKKQKQREVNNSDDEKKEERQKLREMNDNEDEKRDKREKEEMEERAEERKKQQEKEAAGPRAPAKRLVIDLADESDSDTTEVPKRTLPTSNSIVILSDDDDDDIFQVTQSQVRDRPVPSVATPPLSSSTRSRYFAQLEETMRFLKNTTNKETLRDAISEGKVSVSTGTDWLFAEIDPRSLEEDLVVVDLRQQLARMRKMFAHPLDDSVIKQIERMERNLALMMKKLDEY